MRIRGNMRMSNMLIDNILSKYYKKIKTSLSY